jgi:hypothetical protein
LLSFRLNLSNEVLRVEILGKGEIVSNKAAILSLVGKMYCPWPKCRRSLDRFVCIVSRLSRETRVVESIWLVARSR